MIATMSWRSLAERDHLLGEDVGPDRGRSGQHLAGLGVEGAGRVEAGRSSCRSAGVVAVALLGDRVHDAPGRRSRLAWRSACSTRRSVVTVDRADVLQAEVLEHALRRERVLDALLDPVQGVVERRADAAVRLSRFFTSVEHLLVPRVGAQRGQVVGEPADGRRVGAAVVVDDDRRAAVLGGGDVVERLPRHPAGQRAVADDRDDVAVLAAERVAPWPGRRRRTATVDAWRVLDDVVLGLGLARVAGQAALPGAACRSRRRGR